jgi:hypothetical protein
MYAFPEMKDHSYICVYARKPVRIYMLSVFMARDLCFLGVFLLKLGKFTTVSLSIGKGYK